MSSRYPGTSLSGPTPARLALAPGILAAILLLVGVALVATGWFIIFLYAIAILALICCVFAFQSRQWWWMPLFAAIAVIWNPVFPLTFPPTVWAILHLAAAVVFIAAGLLIRVPTTPSAAVK